MGPLAEPRGHLAVAGLVVDHRVRAVGEAIEAIEPAVDGDAAEGDRLLLLYRLDLEVAAVGFDGKPFVREPDEARALQLGEARPKRVEAVLAKVLESGVDASCDERVARFSGGLPQALARAQLLPQRREELVRERAAVARIEAPTRGFKPLGSKTAPGGAAKRTRHQEQE